ncbi:hypothetical protein, partial [Vibrio lentus]
NPCHSLGANLDSHKRTNVKDNQRCFGRNANFTRCGRKGTWRLFCADHKNQWIGWLAFIIFTVLGGLASIVGLFPVMDYLQKEKVVVPGEYAIERMINKAKMEGSIIPDIKDNALLGKVYVRPIAEFIDTEDNFSHIAVTLMSPFKPLGSDYLYKADDCRFLGKASHFDKRTKKARFYIYAASCNRNDGTVYEADARKITGVKEIGYLSLPGLSGQQYVPLIEEGRNHSLPFETNVEIFLDYNVTKFQRVW